MCFGVMGDPFDWNIFRWKVLLDGSPFSVRSRCDCSGKVVKVEMGISKRLRTRTFIP